KIATNMSARPLHIVTPCKHSRPISKTSGFEVWMKLENCQPSGSFKTRGIGHMCLKNKDSPRFVCSSGGNAGLAAAYAGKQLGVPVTIFVPLTTTNLVIEKLKDEGADVVRGGAAWDECNQNALKFVEESGSVYIPPFEHPLIWEGNSSVIAELDSRPDLVICSVGGGGLMCGVVEGLKKRNWDNVPVLAVETHGANSLYQAVQAGKQVTLPAITSIAITLGAKTIGKQAFELTKTHPIIPCLVSDEDVVKTISSFLDDEKILVEPACAASIAVLYNGKLKQLVASNPLLANVKKVVLIVCGGSGVTIDMLNGWKEKFNV
uniref:L-serine ammonia-lyase n=1 Tax=Ciona savignyi TaxID=51511 RepID=H2YKU9_CIOSA